MPTIELIRPEQQKINLVLFGLKFQTESKMDQSIYHGDKKSLCYSISNTYRRNIQVKDLSLIAQETKSSKPILPSVENLLKMMPRACGERLYPMNNMPLYYTDTNAEVVKMAVPNDVRAACNS